jgi:transaldolase
MDAPYHGRVADESHRSKGRSELNFPGYKEDLLVKNLKIIFSYIKNTFPSKKLVIQIARGRSSQQTFDEVLNQYYLDVILMNHPI